MAYNPFYVEPGNDFTQGLSGLTETVRDVRRDRQRQAAEARLAEASTAAQSAFKSGDPSQIAQVSLQYPEVADALKMSTGLQTDLQNQSALGFTRALALASPEERPALYERRIQEITDRGGDPSHTVQSYKDYMDNPDLETRSVISYWAGIDPKGYQAYADEQKTAQKADIEQRKMEIEESRFLRSEAGKNARAQLTASDRAFDREIKLLQAKQSQTMNELKREELQQKIEEKTQKRDEGRQKLQVAAESAAATFDQAIGSADRLLEHPGLNASVGASSALPTLPGSDAADFEAELDTLKAQTFLPQVQALKGAGALSDAEGKKLSDSIGALSTSMSEKRFRDSLARVRDTLNQAKQRALKSAPYGAPAPASEPADGWEIVE